MNILKRLFGSNHGQPESYESKNPFYAPLHKYYAFNETGNVMVCTTNEGGEVVSDSLMYMFSDMSIFFAAMTKAIVTSEKNGDNVGTIYDSDAILKILDKSELFVKLKKELIKISSSAVGNIMSKELTEKLLGREFGESRLNFSRGLFRSMAERTKDAGCIFFICESILGLPMVSAVVVKLHSNFGKGRKSNGKTVEDKEMQKILDIKESDGTNSIVREWEFDKYTYLFISPRSISSANFPDSGEILEYDTLVATLKEHLE